MATRKSRRSSAVRAIGPLGLVLALTWSCGPDVTRPAAPARRAPHPTAPAGGPSFAVTSGIGGVYSMPAGGQQVLGVPLGPTGLLGVRGMPARVVISGAITRQPTPGLLFFCATVEWQWYCKNVWQDLVSGAPIPPAGIWGIYARATASWDGAAPAALAGDSDLALRGPAGGEVWAGRSAFVCYYELSVKNPDGSWKYPYDFGPCHTFGGGFTVTVQPDDGGGALLLVATPNQLLAGGGQVTFAARAADGSALENITWQYAPDPVLPASVPIAAPRFEPPGVQALPTARAALERGEVYTFGADHELVQGRPFGGGLLLVRLPVADAARAASAAPTGSRQAKPARVGAALAGSACDASTTCTQAITRTGSMVVQATVHRQLLAAAARVQVAGGGGRPPTPPKVIITPSSSSMLAPKGLGGDHEILDVSVVDSTGARLPGRAVTLTLEAQEGTAGHAHVGSKPAGALDAEGQETVVTGTDGWAHVMFQAPASSGPVEVHGTSDGATSAVDTVQVGIAGLVQLVESSADTLIGGRAAHPDNHWGTPGMVALATALADSLAHRKLAFDSLPDSVRGSSRFPAKLEVNDMSLVLGGLFDWKATWAPPHDEHRTGHNADIDVRSGAADDLYARAVEAVWRNAFHRRLLDERTSNNCIHLTE